MDKRYQVFVSSTYADLKSERQRVIQALMEMDCIPAGMELFPAMDEAQWDFIKRVIDDCDYYLIIIGGRYGSVTADGISYTEKEFDYANSRGVKIVALIHEDPDSIAVNKSDIDPGLRQKLTNFREKVSANRLVKFWKNADELPGLVVLSLSKTIKTYPAVGWVRASAVASNEMLIEINNLRKENGELSEKLSHSSAQKEQVISELAGFDDPIDLEGEIRVSTGHSFYNKRWNITITWRELFALISPYLMSQPIDSVVKTKLSRALVDRINTDGSNPDIDDQQFRTVGVQFKALGLVSIDYLKTTTGGMGLFWRLTTAGEHTMLQERTIKKKAP